MASSIELDHLIVSAKSLAEGSAYVEAVFGVPLSDIGQHEYMGTHNRLLSLGPSIYLEVIAINPSAPVPPHPRWFNLDDFDGAPRLTHWACRTDNIDLLLSNAPEGTGTSTALSRGDFKWRFAVPESGKHPFDGAMPALLQWDSSHPAPRLKDSEIRLAQLDVMHPEAEVLTEAFPPISDLANVNVVSFGSAGFRAVFETAQGAKELT